MEFAHIFESLLFRLAAIIAALAVIGPKTWKFLVGVYNLTKEVEVIRQHAAESSATLQREFTTNGGSSTVDKLNDLKSQVHVIGELFTAHLADGELKDHHLIHQLREQGIHVQPLEPRERWRWANSDVDDETE